MAPYRRQAILTSILALSLAGMATGAGRLEVGRQPNTPWPTVAETFLESDSCFRGLRGLPFHAAR